MSAESSALDRLARVAEVWLALHATRCSYCDGKGVVAAMPSAFATYLNYTQDQNRCPTCSGCGFVAKKEEA